MDPFLQIGMTGPVQFLFQEVFHRLHIVVGGLLLCAAPKEMVEDRTDYYQQQNEAQIRSVDNNFMRENDSRMPLFREKRSSTSFGKGK